MPYCTAKDVEDAVGGADRLIELIDWDHDGDADDTGASADNERLVAMIDEASAWAARYLSRRVALPLDVVADTVDPSLRKAVAREVVYRFRMARQNVTPADQEEHEETLEWLRSVSTGEATLAADAAAPSESWVGGEVGNRDDLDDEDTFTRKNSGGFW
jgi:phage gp36-like protein